MWCRPSTVSPETTNIAKVEPASQENAHHTEHEEHKEVTRERLMAARFPLDVLGGELLLTPARAAV
jgi:hypothetical protein